MSLRYGDIATFYDTLYESKPDAWKDLAGRGVVFLNYIGTLISTFNPARYLDIGCGQGFLLNAVSASETFGIDISRKAIEGARHRTNARLCLGIIEELPFPNDFFDVVTGMGVMEHFLDSATATQEVARVLRKGGYYILLIYVPISLVERVMIKMAEYLFPRFRPFALCRWALSRCVVSGEHNNDAFHSRDHVPQPVQNCFTHSSAKRLFSASGFRVASMITKRLVPDAPLEGHHFRIYVLQRI
jgi:SAM-dependent methyltransferase